MSSIVCVHGIGQQLKGEETIATEWRDALRDGMKLAGALSHELPDNSDIATPFYGDLFREQGTTKSPYVPYQLADLDPGTETELVQAWLQVAEAGSTVGKVHLGTQGKSGWQPKIIQQMAVALLRYPFFSTLTERLFVGSVKQVRAYFANSSTRQAIRNRVMAKLQPATKLVIAHSLGSVVAYEVLCELRGHVAPTFITLGSPLGLPNIIFDRLYPKPTANKGVWPGDARSWINITDRHDIIAAVKDLAPLFGDKVRDVHISNEAQAHDVQPYLTAQESGTAILGALRG
jgi:hypothetical protein